MVNSSILIDKNPCLFHFHCPAILRCRLNAMQLVGYFESHTYLQIVNVGKSHLNLIYKLVSPT
jgi:hypothetical protein